MSSFGKVAELVFRMMTPQAKCRYTDQSFPFNYITSNPERGILTYKEIGAGATVNWQMELLPLGLFHSNTKLIPLRFMPTILETTLGSMTQMWQGVSGQTVVFIVQVCI